MKGIVLISIWIFALQIFKVSNTHSQSNLASEDSTILYYHYASALLDQKEKKILYISEVKRVEFYKYYNPLIDTGLNRGMEEQYRYFLTRNYGEKDFQFHNFSMSKSKREVKEVRRIEIDQFKKQKAKIVTVKNFVYD
jgi:hypothetical protein